MLHFLLVLATIKATSIDIIENYKTEALSTCNPLSMNLHGIHLGQIMMSLCYSAHSVQTQYLRWELIRRLHHWQRDLSYTSFLRGCCSFPDLKIYQWFISVTSRRFFPMPVVLYLSFILTGMWNQQLLVPQHGMVLLKGLPVCNFLLVLW